MEKLTCEQAKRVSLIDYLASLGHLPQKAKGEDYWYLSPLRIENTASFKVNNRLNVWYDHGLGKGGDLIDFGTAYLGCTISELLEKLTQTTPHLLSFHQQSEPIGLQKSETVFAGEKGKNNNNKIVIVDSGPLASPALRQYLSDRFIPLAIAQKYCKEVDFRLYGRQFTAIGFPNNAGGYELRNGDFKGSSSPKAITLLQGNNKDNLIVFEGFFSFLSFQKLNEKWCTPPSDCLVLNSLSFLDKSRDLTDDYKRVHLFLDRDDAGLNATRKVLEWGTNKQGKYMDVSMFYDEHKDLNEWLVSLSREEVKQQKQSTELKRSIRG